MSTQVTVRLHNIALPKSLSMSSLCFCSQCQETRIQDLVELRLVSDPEWNHNTDTFFVTYYCDLLLVRIIFLNL